MNWALLTNSLTVALLATAAATVFGLSAALWMVTLERRGRRAAYCGMIVAFALPSFLVTGIWIDLLGNTGRLRPVIPFDVYSLWGCAWILGLMLWPVVGAAALIAWRRLEAEQMECDPMLRGNWLLRDLLAPTAAPALRIAAGLVFVLALGNFAVPAILQVKTWPAEIWLRFNTANDTAGALQASWPLLLAPAVLLLAVRHRPFRLPQTTSGIRPRLFKERLGPGFLRVNAVMAILLLGLSTVLPVANLLLSERTWSDLGGAWSANLANIRHSFFLAAVAASLILALGGLTWRKRGMGAAWLGFFLPGALLSVALIPIFNRPGADWIYRGVGVVLIALTLRYVAIGWSGMRTTLRSLDRDGLGFASLCGASRWERFRHGVWPQAGGAMLVVWYAAFLLCLWDVDAVLLVAPPGMQTLPMQVFNLLHYGHNSQVNALCLILLGLALAPLFVWAAIKAALARPAVARVATLAALCGFAALSAGCGEGRANAESGDRKSASALESDFFEGVKLVGVRGTGPGQFNKPRSLAVDAEDNLYVVDMTGRVQKFSESGEYLLHWQMPETDRGRPKGMLADSDGNIVVVEPHYARINHHAVDGALVTQWGRKGEEPGMLAFPRAVAMTSNGDLFVSEFQIVERVQCFSARGEAFHFAFGEAGDGPGEFNRAEGLGVDSEDRVYVADSCNHRIQVFSDKGRFLRTYGSAGAGVGELSYPYDILIDGAGVQYVCEFGNSRLQIFDAEDRSLEIIGGPGGALGEFANPWSIVFDSKGNLYVADSANHRVQKLIRRKGTWKGIRVESVGTSSGVGDEEVDAPNPKLQIPRKTQNSNLKSRIEGGPISCAALALYLEFGVWDLEFSPWRGGT